VSESLYREFHITERTVTQLAAALKVFWTQAVIPFVMKGHKVLLIVTSEEAKRNLQQNKRLWGVVYKQIAEQAWVDGRQFDKDVWHEYYARKYGVCDEMVLPDGEIILRRKSTTEMTVTEFGEYMNRVEADAVMEHGVFFE
jgi:hypothetical protein